MSVLDIDYHHGNGTQAIFYARADVQVVSIHADPRVEYPYFLGHADERGAGDGEGFNLNLPLPHGSDFATGRRRWRPAARRSRPSRPRRWWCRSGSTPSGAIRSAGSRLDTPDYPVIGARIRELGLPTLFVMEGGYAVEAIGVNAVGVLTGFEAA